MANEANAVTRRQALLGGAAGLAAVTCPKFTCAAAVNPSAQKSLGELASAKGLLFGASFAVHELDTPYGDAYAGLYKREVRSITSELELKPGELRPSAYTIEFAPADRLLDFAQTNSLKLRGHTLIWNDYLPEWIKGLSPQDAGRLLEAHVETVLGRYRGRISTWDVVNEPIAPWDRMPGNLRGGPFYSAFGEGYIAKSFRLARQFDPAARRALNEAQTESADEIGKIFRDSLLALVRRLKGDGVPIDAVGLQCHLDSRKPYDFPRFAAFVEELAALGLEIHITELDVNDVAFTSSIRSRDAKVADYYARFLSAVLPIKAVTSLNLWQLADHTSWLVDWSKSEARTSGRTARAPRPLPIDAQFRRKPAWEAIAAALESIPPR